MTARAIEILVQSFPKILLPGLIYTIPLTLISFGIGLVIAIIVALIRVSGHRIPSAICWFYVWVFRGTPQLVQLFIIFYGLPSVGLRWAALPCAVIAFSLGAALTVLLIRSRPGPGNGGMSGKDDAVIPPENNGSGAGKEDRDR